MQLKILKKLKIKKPNMMDRQSSFTREHFFGANFAWYRLIKDILTLWPAVPLFENKNKILAHLQLNKTM